MMAMESHPPQGGGAPRANVAWGFDQWWLSRVLTELRKMDRSVPPENRRVVARRMREQLEHLMDMAEKEARRR